MIFTVETIGKKIEFDVVSYEMILDADRFNLKTMDATFIFELKLNDGKTTYLAVDININKMNFETVCLEAEKKLLKDFKK